MPEYEVTYGENNWLAIVLEHDNEYYEDPYVYEFSNSRRFTCTDRYDSGVYDGS